MGDFFFYFWEIWTFSAFLWISNFLLCNSRRQSRTFSKNLKNLPAFLRKLKNEIIEDNVWEILRNISTRAVYVQMMTSSPRHMSWPDDVLCVVHVVYGFFSEVNHDQTMFYVVHVDYNVVPQVYHDQPMFFVVYVNYHATSSPRSIVTERCFAWFAWTMSSSPRSMTRRCSLRRGWCGLCPCRRC